MVESTPNVYKSRDGEGKISSFAAAAVAALCCTLKGIEKVDEPRPSEKQRMAKFHYLLNLMPLLLDTISNCPSNTQILFNLFNGIYDVAVSLGDQNIFYWQEEISAIMDPLMETLSVDHPLFFEFLSTFGKLCELLNDDSHALRSSLIKMSIKALRFPLKDDGTPEAAMVKKAKSKAWECISFWILFPRNYDFHTEELANVILEQIKNENEIEKLKDYVTALHCMIDVGQIDKTVIEPRMIWIKIWRTLNQLIDDDIDNELTSLCMKEVGACIEKIETKNLAETDLNELGLMVKNVFERETRRRDTDPQIDRNNRAERSGGILNCTIGIFLGLFKKGVPICNVIHPIMPIVFPLIDKCTNKQWGLRFVKIILEFVPEFSLEFKDQIVPLLFDSLTDDHSAVRRFASNSFGQMATSNIADLKEIAVYSLDFICQLMSRPDAKLPGSIVATEDAIAAVIKIIGNCDDEKIGTGRTNEIISRFLSWLPLSGASSECKIAYIFLMDLIDSNHPQIVGVEPNTNSPRLLYILTKAIHDEVYRETNDKYELMERTKKMIKEMASSSDSLNEWIRRSELDEDEEETLRSILTSIN